ncbi:hypothetical protein AMR42_08695 [Limnothrix sp. PR1529]|nr:hypothetical protein AMR42_08695 [Limnothrix sp. PR1529]
MIAGSGHTSIFLFNQLQAGVCELPHHVGGVVGGTIVYNDHFDVPQSLIQDGFDRFSNGFCPVIGGNNNRCSGDGIHGWGHQKSTKPGRNRALSIASGLGLLVDLVDLIVFPISEVHAELAQSA